MAAHVLRLRFALLLGSLRGRRSELVRRVVGLVVLAAATAIAAYGVLSLGDRSDAAAAVVTVFAGAAATLGFAVAPLVTGAVDPLDPRRFAVVGASPRPLAAVLVFAGLLSIPILVLTALAACVAVVWTAHGAATGIAVVSVVLAVLTCALLARVSMAVAALVLRDRRTRELTGVFLVGLLVVVVPVVVFFSSLEWRGTVPSQLQEAARILAVTPVGAVWALPIADSGAAWASWLVALATLALLVLAWFALVRVMLTRTERPAAGRERGGLGWFAVAPGTPGGAVAARSLIYWFRDRRYLVNVIVVPVAAALSIVPLLVAGVPIEIIALVPVPIMALFFGWLPHNDLAYDSTAVWMHIASGMRGGADRLGRLVPVLFVAVPVLAVAIPVAISVHGSWAVLPALVGVCASLLLAGLGLSSISSVASPYPVTRPGDSPFEQPQRTGSAGVMGQGLVMVGALVLSAPALWWAWLTVTRDVQFAAAAFWAGLAGGVLVLAVGVVIGAAVFRRGGSRLMEFAESS